MKWIKPQSLWSSLGTNTKFTDFSECNLCRSKSELQGSIFRLIGWFRGAFRFSLCLLVFFLFLVYFCFCCCCFIFWVLFCVLFFFFYFVVGFFLNFVLILRFLFVYGFWGVGWLGFLVWFGWGFFEEASVKCYMGIQISRKLWNHLVTSCPWGGKKEKGTKEKRIKKRLKAKIKAKGKGRKRKQSRIAVWILKFLTLLSPQSDQGQLRLSHCLHQGGDWSALSSYFKSCKNQRQEAHATNQTKRIVPRKKPRNKQWGQMPLSKIFEVQEGEKAMIFFKGQESWI